MEYFICVASAAGKAGGGYSRWRAALTAVIGALSWFYLPPSPTQTASWFRGKDGWFTEREEVIMVNRVLRDDPGKVRFGALYKERWHLPGNANN